MHPFVTSTEKSIIEIETKKNMFELAGLISSEQPDFVRAGC